MGCHASVLNRRLRHVCESLAAAGQYSLGTGRPAVKTNYVLSPQLLALGKALEPLSKAARQALRRKVRHSGQTFVVLDGLVRHMGLIEHAFSGLAPRLDGLMTDVIQNGGADALVVGRSVGRLEQVLWEFVDGYLDAKACQAGLEGVEAQKLILGVYRHHIESICDWMDEFVTVVLNPEQALQIRGIEPSSEVMLTVSLNMTNPPEMTEIDNLVKSLLAQAEEMQASLTLPEKTREAPPGIFGILGALAFGLGLTGAIFGKKHD